jgi:uncharacterized protein involved in cysteine biosynthesis
VTLVFASFGRALRSQLHPRMIGLLVLPFVATLVFWIVAAVWFFDPLHAWVRSLLFGPGSLPWLAGWTGYVGLQRAGALTTALLAVLLLAPLMFVVSVVLVSIAATPVVTRHLARGAYSDVAMAGRWSLLGGIATATAALAVFAVGYLLTLPLWLVPVAGFLVPWFWWSWLAARILRVDSLAEHATPAERDTLIARHRFGYLVLAMLVTLLNYLPPFFLVTPVLSALAFGHFSLAALRELRAEASAVEPAQLPPAVVVETPPRLGGSA